LRFGEIELIFGARAARAFLLLPLLLAPSDLSAEASAKAERISGSSAGFFRTVAISLSTSKNLQSFDWSQLLNEARTFFEQILNKIPNDAVPVAR
jgi:hypothetical protein